VARNTFPTHLADNRWIVYIVKSDHPVVAYHSGDDCCDSIEVSSGFEAVLEQEAEARGLHACKSNQRGGFDAALTA
jgi:hypothetical protein